MDITLKFEDYKPKELLGKTVLYEYGSTYASRYSSRICRISKVIKSGFKIDDNESIFDFYGRQKGLNSRQDIATHSRCYLITDEESNELRITWRKNIEIKEMKELITKSLESLSHETLTKMVEIIKVKS